MRYARYERSLETFADDMQAFGTFINMNEKAPEFISLFIDDNLKKGLKGVCAPPLSSSERSSD